MVVVSLYNPYRRSTGSPSPRRGQVRNSPGRFVSLNVLSQAQVGKLTEQLGLLPNPGLLIYARPSTLAARISGFADKETVAQAAQNAARRDVTDRPRGRGRRGAVRTPCPAGRLLGRHPASHRLRRLLHHRG